MITNNKNLTSKLLEEVKLSKDKRLTRLLKKPIKRVYPKILKWKGISKEVVTKTFFDVHMRVVIPELVSTHIWQYGFLNQMFGFLIDSLKPGNTFIDIGAHFVFLRSLAPIS